jgi:hypothetical protein
MLPTFNGYEHFPIVGEVLRVGGMRHEDVKDGSVSSCAKLALPFISGRPENERAYLAGPSSAA